MLRRIKNTINMFMLVMLYGDLKIFAVCLGDGLRHEYLILFVYKAHLCTICLPGSRALECTLIKPSLGIV